MEYLFIYIFLISLILFLYNYFIYPLGIISISKLKSNSKYNNADNTFGYPNITFIIAAYNEEKVIDDKIKNTLKLDYPKDKIQVIIVSDGSNDRTEDIVKSYNGNDILSLHENERNGKSAALNRAANIASGDILVFSDANNDFSGDSIKHLVKHFSDPHIGAVTGAKKIYTSKDRQAATGDGLYWKYESKIKEAESNLGSITGAEGEILAVRKILFTPIEKHLINDDAAITFSVVKSGHRIIYEKNAIAFEEASIDLVDDFNVKVRMTAGGFQTLALETNYLLTSFSWFSFTFLSHKVLRWFAPHFLLLIFATSILLLNKTEFLVIFYLQIIFYSVSLIGWINRSKKLHNIIYIPMYFSAMNCALFVGFLKYMSNKTNSIWKKAER